MRLDKLPKPRGDRAKPAKAANLRPQLAGLATLAVSLSEIRSESEAIRSHTLSQIYRVLSRDFLSDMPRSIDSFPRRYCPADVDSLGTQPQGTQTPLAHHCERMSVLGRLWSAP